MEIPAGSLSPNVPLTASSILNPIPPLRPVPIRIEKAELSPKPTFNGLLVDGWWDGIT